MYLLFICSHWLISTCDSSWAILYWLIDWLYLEYCVFPLYLDESLFCLYLFSAETSDIGWEIDQEGAGENVTFLLMCYYNSSCDLERIVLLGYRNDGNLAPLRPVEFICKTMKGGNEMMCSGSIPIAVVNMTESIVCLPELQNETEALRRATVISKHEMLCSNNTNSMYNVLCHAQKFGFFLLKQTNDFVWRIILNFH